MSEDLKKLETLSYRPKSEKCPYCENGTAYTEDRRTPISCPTCEGEGVLPAKSSPATLGMNSAVIKPAKRVNKAEDVEQPECKTCKGFEDKYNVQTGTMIPCPDCQQPNLKIIGEIEGLFSQVHDKLEKIECIFDTENPKPWQAKDTALEEIDVFQKTTLHELRKEFE